MIVTPSRFDEDDQDDRQDALEIQLLFGRVVVVARGSGSLAMILLQSRTSSVKADSLAYYASQ